MNKHKSFSARLNTSYSYGIDDQDFVVECVDLSSSNDGGGTSGSGGGGVELTQNGEQQAEAGDIDQTTSIS